MLDRRLEMLLKRLDAGGEDAELLHLRDRILRSVIFQVANKHAKAIREMIENYVLGMDGPPIGYSMLIELNKMLDLYARTDGKNDLTHIRIDADEGCLVTERVYPKLFVSHSSRDAEVASALASTVESAFELRKDYLRCSSVSPYRLAAGERTADRLRSDLSKSEIVIGMFGPDTHESQWVNFEIGGAWCLQRLTYPLLIHGANLSHIPEPIRVLHALDLRQESDVQELIDAIAENTSLVRKVGVAGSVSERVHRLVRLAA